MCLNETDNKIAIETLIMQLKEGIVFQSDLNGKDTNNFIFSC